MLVMFLPIFVADIKIIWSYNFVAPLKAQQNPEAAAGGVL